MKPVALTTGRPRRVNTEVRIMMPPRNTPMAKLKGGAVVVTFKHVSALPSQPSHVPMRCGVYAL